MRNAFVLVAMFILALVEPAAAEDAASRASIMQSIRNGYIEAAGGSAPNVIDLLSTRFPEDWNRLLDVGVGADKANASQASANLEIAKVFATIQARDGDKFMLAPRADLEAVIGTTRDITIALGQGHQELCKSMMSATVGSKSPTPEIGRLSLKRLYEILTAIADGRDKPAPPRQSRDDDITAFALAAEKRGVDMTLWASLAPDRLADAPADKVCAALVSMYGAALSTPGDLGERIMATFGSELLVKDAGFYRAALEK